MPLCPPARRSETGSFLPAVTTCSIMLGLTQPAQILWNLRSARTEETTSSSSPVDCPLSTPPSEPTLHGVHAARTWHAAVAPGGQDYRVVPNKAILLALRTPGGLTSCAIREFP